MKLGAKASALWYKAFNGKLGGKINVPSKVNEVNALTKVDIIQKLPLGK